MCLRRLRDLLSDLLAGRLSSHLDLLCHHLCVFRRSWFLRVPPGLSHSFLFLLPSLLGGLCFVSALFSPGAFVSLPAISQQRFS